ncbi:MAG: rhodanese-like domain-containing protein [Gammaproteobacteria bacterium]
MTGSTAFERRDAESVRADLRAGREIALLDVREEDVHAQSHPLFAAHLPLGRIEIEAYARLPRRDVPITLVDDRDAGLADEAARRFASLGFTSIAILAGGVEGWRASGGELFRDVNVPSKAFGELVESVRHTPSLPAPEIKRLLDEGADVVVLDARRFDEYQTMTLPGSISVPGGELAYRVRELAPRPGTTVIVHCAGRTRSIIGTQSLVNAGIPNRVVALRNGTIGWTLAGLGLEHGQRRRPRAGVPEHRDRAAQSARALAERAGVGRIDLATLERWRAAQDRTTYLFDVRSEEEYAQGHLPGARAAPGGQLVQETDAFAPVRGARIVLADDDGVRADMTASWLAQMAWEVAVLSPEAAAHFSERGAWQAPLPPVPAVPRVSVADASAWLRNGDAVAVDIATSRVYLRGHVPGAWFVQRSRWPADLGAIPRASRHVLASPDGTLAAFACAELQRHLPGAVSVLDGGTHAWQAAGLPLETGGARMPVPPDDVYRRPYEGTDVAPGAMQAYLDWEFGLVEQLGRDATHGFRVL